MPLTISAQSTVTATPRAPAADVQARVPLFFAAAPFIITRSPGDVAGDRTPRRSRTTGAPGNDPDTTSAPKRSTPQRSSHRCPVRA